MKKIVLALMVLILMSSPAFARGDFVLSGQPGESPGKGKGKGRGHNK